jgi:tetrapyrrole methylase family protein/MazG family protein
MQKNRQLLICGIESEGPEIFEKLRSADLIIVRDQMVVHWLEQNNINNFTRFSLHNEKTLKDWVEYLSAEATKVKKIAYVTPFSPVLTDQVALSLWNSFNADLSEIIAGRDFSIDLLKKIPANSSSTLLTVDGLSLKGRHHPPFSADHSVLIYSPDDVGRAELLVLLGRIYKTDQPILILTENSTFQPVWTPLHLGELGQVDGSISALFIPYASLDHSLESFEEIIAHLRAPEDGCPWDKKQTHSSLRTYLLEETYEALDALDKNDLTSLKEELGDILLQILLHAQIASEAGEFTLADVISGINRKIVYRHPHVFKDWVVNDELDVVQNWESLKGQERLKNVDEAKKGMLDGVPISFPALAQAQSIQDRAARVGFDWPDIAPVMDKVLEELEEVKTAPNDQELAKELGDLLFAIVNLIRWHKVDAESALRYTNLKFRKRFAYIEEQARLAGKDLQKMTLAEMDAFWEQAKAFDD